MLRDRNLFCGVRVHRLVLLPALVACALALGATPAQATFPGTNGKIAYARYYAGIDIWTMNHNGTAQTQLTNSEPFERGPRWSPDGRRIAFNSTEGNYDIYVMNGDGSAAVNVTDAPSEEIGHAWSADGGAIAFSSNRDTGPGSHQHLYLMNADGTQVERLTYAAGGGGAPDWSPDGRSIAFERWGDIWVLDVPTGTETQLTDGPEFDTTPSWSPDGTRIAFQSGEYHAPRVRLMDADGTDVVPLPGDQTRDTRSPSWTADGTAILFGSEGQSASSTDMFSVSPSPGSTWTNLTQTPFADENGGDSQPLSAVRPPTISSGPIGPIGPTSATFEFASSQAGVSLHCSLDGAAFAPCSSPVEHHDLDPGVHSFAVRARNASGLESVVATRWWSVDRVPPDTSITTGPRATQAVTSAVFGFSSGDLRATFECRLDGGNWGPCVAPATRTGLAPGRHVLEVRGRDPFGNADPTPASREVRVVRPFTVDFGGDGVSDLLVFRPQSGGWYRPAGAFAFFGRDGDVPVPGQWDDDESPELAVYRPASGGWYVPGSATVFLGAAGDVPVPMDWNGDGKLEPTVFRPASGAWYRAGLPTAYFGRSADVPLPGQWDADPELDLAVYRPANGGWHVQGRPTVFLGAPDDVPVPADFDGNGTLDPATFRPSAGTWHRLGHPTVYFGRAGDIPVPGQWDADPEADLKVYRPANGGWYHETGFVNFLGAADDIP